MLAISTEKKEKIKKVVELVTLCLCCALHVKKILNYPNIFQPVRHKKANEIKIVI